MNPEPIQAILNTHRIIARNVRRQQHGEQYRVEVCGCLQEFVDEDVHRAHIAAEILAASGASGGDRIAELEAALSSITHHAKTGYQIATGTDVRSLFASIQEVCRRAALSRDDPPQEGTP